MLLQLTSAVVSVLVVTLLRGFVHSSPPGENTAVLIGLCAIALSAATGSRTIYSRIDRLRARAPRPGEKGPAQRGWGVLFWLAWSQTRNFAIGMAVFAFLGTVAVLFLRLPAWPIVTLFLGVLCGVTAFADEQYSGAFGFAGDQRFPLGRIWLVKCGIRTAVGVGALVLMTLGVAATFAVQEATFTPQERLSFNGDIQSGLASGLMTNPFAAIVLWPIYGYAVSLFFSVLIRRPMVAGVAAVGIAYPLAFLWLPSLFVGGGLRSWQLWGVPAVLLIASRALMRSRVADNLRSRRAVVVVVGAALVAGLWQTAALGYRAVGVPLVPAPVDIAAFTANLPTPQENEAGRLSAAALRRLTEIERDFDREQTLRGTGELPAPNTQPVQPESGMYLDRANTVVSRGWEPKDRQLSTFLDRFFADPWARDLATAADLPSGIVVDPRDLNPFSQLPELRAAQRAAILLAARGLEKQAEGDSGAFVDNLRTTLVLSRNMRHQTVIISVGVGDAVAFNGIRGVERWLERLAGRPDLLRRALDALRWHHNEPCPTRDEIFAAQLLVTMNSLADPNNLPNNGNRFNDFFFGRLDGTDLTRLTWNAPWEKVRTNRLLNACASWDPEVERRALEISPPLLAQTRISGRLPFFQILSQGGYPKRRQLADTRAAVLQVALRLYQAEKGKPAEKLEQLVPEYLQSVPSDPYDGRPFRYRLSAGEILDWPSWDSWDSNVASYATATGRSDRKIPAGAGILWSVGEDLRDDGGHAQFDGREGYKLHQEDLIYPVPPPPERK